MTNWLGTNSGNMITLSGELTDNDFGQITIEDIATGLSNICRFNGQVKHWYSVAEHSINVSRLVPKPYKKVALLHDAAEAFICDIPTPLKRELGDAYRKVEHRLWSLIASKFDLPLELPKPVIEADRLMLMTERDGLIERPARWSDEYEDTLRVPGFHIRAMYPQYARQQFLDEWTKVQEI